MVLRREVVHASGGLGLGVESIMAGSSQIESDRVGIESRMADQVRSSRDSGLKIAQEVVFERLV